MGYSAVAFIIVIGVLVFFHELGHFLVARWCGVGVDVFSLGFGPKLLKRKVGRTEYCLSAIPLGGYVKMVGEDASADIDPADKSVSFSHKSLGKRSAIVGAGPAFNFLLAIVIFYLLYQISGIYMTLPKVGEVVENSPAQTAGILAGDVIKEVNDMPVKAFEDIPAIIAQGDGKDVFVLVERGGEVIGYTMRPEVKSGENLFGETENRYVIGIVGSGETFHERLGPVKAMGKALSDTWGLVELTVLSVVKMINGTVSADNLGGPIMIAQMAGQQAKAGMVNFVWFIALLSVNLGIINLFPIPVLDGGHLMFFALEGVLGHPVSDKLRERLIQFGAAMLVTLMIFVFYNDIARIINGG